MRPGTGRGTPGTERQARANWIALFDVASASSAMSFSRPPASLRRCAIRACRQGGHRCRPARVPLPMPGCSITVPILQIDVFRRAIAVIARDRSARRYAHTRSRFHGISQLIRRIKTARARAVPEAATVTASSSGLRSSYLICRCLRRRERSGQDGQRRCASAKRFCYRHLRAADQSQCGGTVFSAAELGASGRASASKVDPPRVRLIFVHRLLEII